MPKNTVLQRFLKTGYFSNIPHTIEDVLRLKPSLRFSRKPTGAHRQPKYLKGVGRDGNYYRLKIPPRRRPLPRIPKLPKGQQQIAPKPLSPPPPSPESAAEILGYKRRLFKWLLGNLPILVLNFGSTCTLLAFTRSDILELRSLSVTGNVCFIVYSLSQKIILWPNIFWSLLFGSVNSWKIYQIFDERNASVSMTKNQERIFVDFFMPHGVTPKQFERIEQSSEVIQLKKGELLIQKGEKPHSVYLIVEGSTNALRLGRRLTAASTTFETRGLQKEGGDSGAWAGEMAFLKQFWEKEQRAIVSKGEEKATTNSSEENDKEESDSKGAVKIQHIPSGRISEAYIYSIIATEDCTVMSWSHEQMEELMKSSTDLRAALTRAMSSALVGKVVNLTMSRSQNTAVPPWLEWLKEWKSTDGTSVEIDSEFRLAEDRD
eukprot:CAMPEP_0116134640 /NCGR_PEP_ID=MMETSP0329-20121206/10760_1 /TAXON_ID=697910 /ORGANISM="Pseudo-nitzschia arenysensis, Strain B593" /LENGTH=431 /DNA_ID=CAMNT_0003629377 /DNA_START=9 /DNA_END=1304 /DNA_ORIENTATION=-